MTDREARKALTELDAVTTWAIAKVNKADLLESPFSRAYFPNSAGGGTQRTQIIICG